MSNLEHNINVAIASINNIKVAARIEFNRAFEKKDQTEEAADSRLRILGNIGALCDMTLARQITQMQLSLSMLRDIAAKEVSEAEIIERQEKIEEVEKGLTPSTEPF